MGQHSTRCCVLICIVKWVLSAEIDLASVVVTIVHARCCVRAPHRAQTLRDDLQPRLAAQLHKISTSSPFQRTSSSGSMGRDSEGGHDDRHAMHEATHEAGVSFWDKEGVVREGEPRQGEPREKRTPGAQHNGGPSGSAASTELISLEEEEEVGAGEALYQQRLEQAQRAQEARRAMAVPDLLTGAFKGLATVTQRV